MPTTQPEGAILTLAQDTFVDAKFSRDSSRLYAIGTNTVTVFNVGDRSVITTYQVGTKLAGFDISADGRYLAVAEATGINGSPTAYRIDLTTGTIATISSTAYTGSFYDMGYLNDGTLVASGLTNLMGIRFDTNEIFPTVTNIGIASISPDADHKKLLIEKSDLNAPLYVYTSPNQISNGVFGVDDPYAGASVPQPSLVSAISPGGDRIAQDVRPILYDWLFERGIGRPTDYESLVGASQGMAFSTDSRYLYTLSAGASPVIVKVDTLTATAVAAYAIPGQTVLSSISELAWMKTGLGGYLQASLTDRYLEVILNDGIKLIDLTKVQSMSTPGDDVITGSGYLLGLAGNDTLTATSDFTTLGGGTGDDVYYAQAYNVFVSEGQNQGRDTVHSSTGFTLGFNVEDLILDGNADASGSGNDLANLMVGNAGANSLIGYAGADTLRGGGGADTLEGWDGADLIDGGDGDDVLASGQAAYSPPQEAFDSLADRDTLIGGAGNDRLYAGFGDAVDGGSGTDALWLDLRGATAGVDIDLRGLLTNGASVTVGGAAITGVEQVLGVKGSNFADRIDMQVDRWAIPTSSAVAIYGQGGNDVILAGVGVTFVSGGDGDDQLIGYGSATLDGGSGNDYLYATATTAALFGGDGDDAYVVRGSIPQITETSGYDTVFVDNAGYGQAVYRLQNFASIEVLTTQSNTAVSTVTIAGNTDAQIIVGDWGNNVLIGGGVSNPTQADVLIGLRGDDRYIVDGVRTVIFENAGEGADVAVVSANASNFVLNAATSVETIQAASGTDAINITGNPDAQTIIGNDGVNILSGAGGGDTLIGLGGNDTYQVRSTSDQVVETNGGGFDTVFATVSYSLGANEIEVLSTVVQAANDPIDLIGNYASQLVIGNYGNNVLNGGSGGIDTLIGLFGDDTYAVGDARVVIVENAGQGNDTVVTSVSYQLRNGVSIETLAAQNRAGTDALVLTGNGAAQVVAGNDGANTIDGRGGADTLVGGGGADVFVFSTAAASGNADTILDFQAGVDRIGLATDVFAAVTDGGIQSGEFVFGTAAADGDDRLVYDQASGRLFYDADGNGSGAAVLLAQLAVGTALTAASFTTVAPVMDLAA